MIKKYVIVLLIIILSVVSLSAANVVAQVGQNRIYFEQLAQEMQQLESMDDISYSDLRNLALENLIEKELLNIYAEENNIFVSSEELDSFFIDQLGSVSRFQTEGLFDFDKYEQFKETENGKNILTEMEKEVLIRKAKTLIISQFNITDDVLLKEYIINNAEIDISYSIIDVDAANVTDDFTAEEATNYFYNNRKDFLSPRKVMYDFVIVPFSEFSASAEDYYELSYRQIVPADSLFTSAEIDSIKYDFINNYMKQKALETAEEQMIKLKRSNTSDYPVLTSDFLAENESFGQLPSNLSNKALEMERGDISNPIDIGIGYLILKVRDVTEPDYLELDENPELVWETYIKHRKEQYHEGQFRSYFSKNIDDFIIPVSVVKVMKIKKPIYKLNTSDDEFIQEIRDEISRRGNDEESLEYIAEQYNLKEKNLIVMLEKFYNEEKLADTLAVLINEGFKAGFCQFEDDDYYYQETTFFPEFIPRFSDIKNQIQDIQYTNEMDESDYQTFFEEHSKEFRAADSLQLGGAYFFIANDTIAIDSTMVYEYYRDNLDSFYLDKSVAFDYIAVDKRQTINRIRNYLLYDVDFDLLKYCYSNELEIANIQYHQQKDLPVIIEENLNVIDKGEISQPIEFENQWVILRKNDTKSEGVQNFEDVKDDIGAMLLENVAREIVYQNAKTAFDSTSYFSQIRSYADSSAVFKTEFQDIKEPFEILGDLSKYGQEFLRFWRNEKYSSIINLPDDKGYAVIYILRKKPSKAMTFDEALPQLKKIFTSRKSFDTAEAYVKGLRERILDGEDPNELLYFLGGWQQEENLDFNSKIFGKEWSRLILEDIASHEEGYFSPILSLSEKQLLFYQINRLKKIPRDQFLAEKDQFKQAFLDKRYKQWLHQFRNTIGVDTGNY